LVATQRGRVVLPSTGTAVLAGHGAGSSLLVFIPATGSSLQLFIVTGQAVTEITR